eukprot:TRINITY_DN30248_c0_g1_i1.p1 TRINITY_DN30248_c0_g1~~TRINITY_DN30248_c0_g1_i1.p1  ORF type:complete len:319 (-),score=59.72 TRINITY_DN30248_c0_g1_i1:678-1634(-)
MASSLRAGNVLAHIASSAFIEGEQSRRTGQSPSSLSKCLQIPCRSLRNLPCSSRGMRKDRSVISAVAVGEGSPAQFAKEMERVSAKEALLLAIKDAGGVNALTSGEGNKAGRIDVSEKVLALERLNPTPRPTTSAFLEGAWEFVWASARSPALRLAKIVIQRFPKEVASLDSLVLEILPGGAEATASVKVLNSVETTFTLTTKLIAEGPLRLKEEYVEGLLAPPVIPEDSLPGPIKSVYESLVSAAAGLPESVKDVLSGGLKVPLSGYFERQLLISYLDDEIMVARDSSGVPDVLLRTALPLIGADVDTPAILEEYVS